VSENESLVYKAETEVDHGNMADVQSIQSSKYPLGLLSERLNVKTKKIGGRQMSKIYLEKKGRGDGEKGGLSNTLQGKLVIPIIIMLSIYFRVKVIWTRYR
jgi:hypothetical protein